MSATPCAILIVTATIDGNSSKVFEALGAGALDAVQTPALLGSGEGSSALKFKIDMLQRRVSGEGSKFPETQPGISAGRPQAQAKERLVAIGASAGGPAAVAAILSKLPADFPAIVVIVQHIDEQFVPSMVSWLNEHSVMPVRIASHGHRPLAAVAVVAGTNDHLSFIDSSMLGYVTEPRQCSYRPSIDVFFESIVRHWRGEAIGVLLSGMGRDGAVGMKKLRDSGAVTIAQDPATSAVYGMPKAAVELKAATKVLHLHSIASELVNLCSVRKHWVQEGVPHDKF